MGKKILAVLSGIIVAVATMFLFEGINSNFFPLPKDVNLNDPEVVKNLFLNLPATAFILVIMGWFFGAFLGGFTVKYLSKEEKPTLAWILGGALTLSSIANVMMLPHPIWVTVIAVVIFIPAAYWGFNFKKYPLQ